MREPQETHMSSHLDEIVAAVSLTPGKTIPNKPPQTALFQPPREKLHLCEEKAKSCSSRREYKQAIQELVRCVALTRICYGDCHWKLAEAYVNLAQGYLQLEGLSLQAKQHAEKAREVLASAIAPPCDNSTDVFRCSVELFHTMGRAFLSLQKFKEAAKNLTKAERLSQELLQCGRVAKEEWLEVQARIKLSFAQMYQAQKKSKEALPHYQEALEYTEISKGEKSLECAPVLRELAGAEQALKCHDAAINHFLQAHLIVLGGEPSEEEAAASSHCVARAAVASGRPEHHDVAEQYFQESLASLHHAEGTGKAKLLSIQDEYCHFLQVTGQEERATSILRESLKAKVGVFGDLSPEVAETYRLLSGADVAQGNHSGAHKKLNKRPLPAGKSGEHHGHQTEISTEKAHMLLLHRDPAWFRDGVIADIFTQVEGCKKELVKAVSLCLQIQTLLYGPQDRRTLATQQSMDVLSKAPEMAGKLRQAPKAKPASCLGVAQHTAPGKARPHTVN